MLELDSILNKTKELIVLYVEDNETVQQSTTILLSNFFKKVIVKSDGKEGLKTYRENKDQIDFIISDIEMPKMTGLEMVELIRKENKDIPIIITTAFSEEKYFIQAISLKIDRYLIKPIQLDKVVDVIEDIATHIYNQKELKRLQELQHNKILEDKMNEMVLKISDAYALPTAIFKDNSVFYLSRSFQDLFSTFKEAELKQLLLTDTKLFTPKKGHLSSLNEFDTKNTLNNRVKVEQKIGHKIFKVTRKSIDLDGDAIIYIFTDITLEEYQKTKIDSYLDTIDDLASKSHKTSVKEKFISKEYSSSKISAKAYIATLSEVTLRDVQELNDLNTDLIHSIQHLRQSEILGFEKTASLFLEYVDAISHFSEFEDIFIALDEFSRLLHCIDILNIDEQKHMLLVNFLDNLREILHRLLVDVFIHQNAENIHFLDSAIIRICIDLNILITHEL